MATITLKGNTIHTSGTLPKVGAEAPGFELVRMDLANASLKDFAGKKKILNIFPSLDTGTCALSVRKFNQEAAKHRDVTILNISADLPFAQKRFCGAEGIESAQTLSAFRSTFAKDYGLQISDGPLAGLCSRAVLVLDEKNHVLYAEQVPEIGQEPNYEAALAKI